MHQLLSKKSSTKDKLHASWLVATPYKDIADIYVNVRDARNNRVLLERHLPYDARHLQLAGTDLVGDSVDETALQLCIQAKNSDGSIGSWFDAQCYALPSDFANVRRRYNAGFNGVRTMLSSKPPRNGSAGSKRGAKSAAGSQHWNGVFGTFVSGLVVVTVIAFVSMRDHVLE